MGHFRSRSKTSQSYDNKADHPRQSHSLDQCPDPVGNVLHKLRTKDCSQVKKRRTKQLLGLRQQALLRNQKRASPNPQPDASLRTPAHHEEDALRSSALPLIEDTKTVTFVLPVNFVEAQKVPAMLDEFLNAVRDPVQRKDAERLRDILQVEPPLDESYNQVINELRNRYPKGNDEGLSHICDDLAPPHPEGGSSWGAFGEVIRRYLVFLRDLDLNSYLNIFNSLKSLLK